MAEDMTTIRKELDDHEDRLRELEEKTIRTDVLTENCIKALDKLDNTIESVTTVMNSVVNTMTKMEGTMGSLTQKVDQSDKSIKNLYQKLDDIEEKGKFDISLWLKENFILLVTILILLGLSIPQIGKLLGLN